MTHLGGPPRMIDGDHQGLFVESYWLHVVGNRRSDDLLPTGEEPTEASRSPEAELVGYGIERGIECSWPGVPPT